MNKKLPRMVNPPPPHESSLNELFLQKMSRYMTLNSQLSTVFQANTESLTQCIYYESTTLPIDGYLYIEIEVQFEVKTKLLLQEVDYMYIEKSTLIDYMFLIPSANNLKDFILFLSREPRYTGLLNCIILFRKNRVRPS